MEVLWDQHHETMPVPYPDQKEDGSPCCGYLDLRDNPVEAKKIGKGEGGPAFADLLESIARNPRWMSIGCAIIADADCGYLQFASRRYASATLETYQTFCHQITDQLAPVGIEEIRFMLAPCRFDIDDEFMGEEANSVIVYWYSPDNRKLYRAAQKLEQLFR